MNVTLDTNILVRVSVKDDPVQTKQAQAIMRDAEQLVVPVVVLAEMAWVLHRVYQLDRQAIRDAIQRLVDIPKVITDRPAVEFGLRLMEANGDFADGVVACQGQELGADTFVSFDTDALKKLKRLGFNTRRP